MKRLYSLFNIILVVAMSGILLGQNVWDGSNVATTTENGNVGIGTAFPRSRLDLGDGGLNKSIRMGEYLDIGETDYRNFVYLGINSIYNSSSIPGRYNRFIPHYAPGQGLIMAQSVGGAGSLDFYSIDWNGDNSERDFPEEFTHVVRFDYDGQIGVGTRYPRSRLDLGKGGINNSLRIGDYLDIGETSFENFVYFGINSIYSSSSIAGRYNRFRPHYARGQGLVLAQSSNGWGSLNIYGINWNGKEEEKNFPEDFTHVIHFSYDGRVGIGTENPTHSLTVNGDIRAEELVISSVGADFVFEDDYQLPPLEQVEAFIRENKHLPEIPPAEKMQKQGAGVGELQTKLLQKIEELTLYMIEMKKAQTRQARKLDELKEENTALKKRISALQNVKQ